MDALGQQIRLNSEADGHSPDERESLLMTNSSICVVCIAMCIFSLVLNHYKD
uniref:Uncharacterized protein n=1 Tax=uncultured Thiotrichaceae bacterium TaxID=298394 RepID=A0A6S6T243_9GAMM|nr:MAG: Unknown protein [uncultured Thiotrichaceae bacterium]